MGGAEQQPGKWRGYRLQQHSGRAVPANDQSASPTLNRNRCDRALTIHTEIPLLPSPAPVWTRNAAAQIPSVFLIPTPAFGAIADKMYSSRAFPSLEPKRSLRLSEHISCHALACFGAATIS